MGRDYKEKRRHKDRRRERRKRYSDSESSDEDDRRARRAAKLVREVEKTHCLFSFSTVLNATYWSGDLVDTKSNEIINNYSS